MHLGRMVTSVSSIVVRTSCPLGTGLRSSGMTDLLALSVQNPLAHSVLGAYRRFLILSSSEWRLV